MSQIKINSHDVLGKLTIIKNCLSLLKSKNPKEDRLVKMAFQANQELIDMVKTTVKNG